MTDQDQQTRRRLVDGFDIERQTYATIVLMSVLAVYDGWKTLSFVEATFVMVSPVFALGAAHLFSEGLHEHAEKHRPLNRREWRHLAVRQLQLLLAAAPPLLMLLIGRTLHVNIERVTLAILATGVVTLMGLAALAAHRAELRGWRFAATVVAGGLVGMLVLSIQILLKPS